jgi:hypothetical protein
MAGGDLVDATSPTFIIAQIAALDAIDPPADDVRLNRLPQSDPHVSGQAWNNAGVVDVSNG